MNDVDNILLVAKGTIFAGFLFCCYSEVGMYFRMIWTTEHAVAHRSFLCRSSRKLVRKILYYLDFLIQSLASHEFFYFLLNFFTPNIA